MVKMLSLLLFLCVQLVVFAPLTFATSEPTDAVPENARCTVCGMFVAKYPNWLARVHYDTPDKTLFFDGVKDMMVFYFSPEKYGSTSRETIKEMYVRDYYTLKWLRAEEAYFVAGSNVYGPMGHELVPFQSKEAAEAFSKDHHGQKILAFHEITPALIESLRLNQKMR